MLPMFRILPLFHQVLKSVKYCRGIIIIGCSKSALIKCRDNVLSFLPEPGFLIFLKTYGTNGRKPEFSGICMY